MLAILVLRPPIVLDIFFSHNKQDKYFLDELALKDVSNSFEKIYLAIYGPVHNIQEKLIYL
jgi:hypothetical protein